MRDRLVCLALFLATAGITLAAAPNQGIHRDEAYYMVAAEQYVTYFEHALSGKLDRPLSDGSIRRYWDYNHEHPPLMKVLYGVAWRLFHRCACAEEAAWHPGPARLAPGERHVTLALFDWESTAFRLPTILFFAWLVVLVYRFYVRFLAGKTALPLVGAVGAALLAAAQPRAFFHAQTAAFDLPAATLWLATTLAYFRALQSPRPWRASIGVGLLYGLFLATKLQSFFLPVALGAHWLLLAWTNRKQVRPSLAPLVAMATLGPLVFFASWPWLWHDTVRRVGAYLHFHLTHVHYNFEYLGVNYNTPPYPWHEPLGMLLFTAPVILLALAAAGIAILLKRGRDPQGTRALLLFTGLLPIALFLYGQTPIFGETKHWLATMPILALCAGVALQQIAAGLAALPSVRFPRLVGAALVIVAVAPAVAETARSHPYGLSHYNALAGGAPGGADLGLNRQFWGYAVAGLLPWIDRELPENTPIYLHDWNHDAYLMYLRDGRLRPDLRDAGMEQPGVDASRAALVVLERHFAKYEYMIWQAYGTTQPAEVLTLDGVPLVPIYRRPTQ